MQPIVNNKFFIETGNATESLVNILKKRRDVCVFLLIKTKENVKILAYMDFLRTMGIFDFHADSTTNDVEKQL